MGWPFKTFEGQPPDHLAVGPSAQPRKAQSKSGRVPEEAVSITAAKKVEELHYTRVLSKIQGK